MGSAPAASVMGTKRGPALPRHTTGLQLDVCYCGGLLWLQEGELEGSGQASGVKRTRVMRMISVVGAWRGRAGWHVCVDACRMRGERCAESAATQDARMRCFCMASHVRGRSLACRTEKGCRTYAVHLAVQRATCTRSRIEMYANCQIQGRRWMQMACVQACIPGCTCTLFSLDIGILASCCIDLCTVQVCMHAWRHVGNPARINQLSSAG